MTRWLFLTVPGFALSALLLALVIRSLLRTLSGAVVTTLPVQESQTLHLEEPGAYDLYVEGRLGTTDFRGLQYELTSAAGMPIPMEGVLFRSTVTSMSGRAKLQVRSFAVAEPGGFVLRIAGLRPDAASGNRVVISRPVRARMVLHIVGVVVLGVLTIGSLVASALLLVRARTPPP